MKTTFNFCDFFVPLHKSGITLTYVSISIQGFGDDIRSFSGKCKFLGTISNGVFDWGYYVLIDH